VPSLDTNILVRILTGDDARQSASARSLIENRADHDELLFVPLTVTLELEWVLRAAYGFAKEEVLATLVGLLETRELEFQDEASIERSIHLYRSGNADFAECLHIGSAITHDRAPLLTFDRKAARVDGAMMLS
jgi:predicted nucleic-acid-binding protein